MTSACGVMRSASLMMTTFQPLAPSAGAPCPQQVFDRGRPACRWGSPGGKRHSTFLEGDRVVLRGLNTTWEAQGRWHAMFGQGRDDREATNADGGARE